MKVYAQQNDNLDAIIYRHFGTSYGLLEETLQLNPKLAANEVLEIGTPVMLPTIIDNAKQVKTDTVQLWTERENNG